MKSLRRYLLDHLGPGLITGAADDDPSGIATYSQAGAAVRLRHAVERLPDHAADGRDPDRFGAHRTSLPGTGSRTTCASTIRAGCCTRSSALLLVANTINIAADVAAMGEALQLIVGGPEHGHAVIFGVVVVLLQIFLPYQRLAPLLKWFTLSLLSTSPYCSRSTCRGRRSCSRRCSRRSSGPPRT